MDSQRIFTVTITVDDAVGFVANTNSALRYIIGNYEGRCWQGCFIVRVVEIIRKSKCVISQGDMSGKGTIDITFRAEVMFLGEGDFVAGCTIQTIVGPTLFVATAPHLVINVDIRNDPLAKTYAEGQIIPCIVQEPRFGPFCEIVAVYAIPFLHHNRARDMILEVLATPAHNSTSKLTDDNLTALTDRRDALLDKVSKLSTADQFFVDLMYPYKKRIPEFTLSKKTTTVILRIDGSISEYHRTDGIDSNIIPTVGSAELQTRSISRQIEHMNMILSFATNYDTTQKRKMHSNIFDSISASKLVG